jgi:HD-like signal output (HDOD) protein
MPTTNAASLDQILATSQLPALPQSALRLLQLSQNPDNGPNEFALPIESDPGLEGQVLKFVNSSYFGFAREISTIKLALALVGVRTIQNFALWSAVFSVVPNPKCGTLDIKVLWQDSLRRGLFARVTARKLGLKESEDLFTAALLQDMAIPVLAKELAASYEAVLVEAKGDNRRLAALESEKFGWDHAQAAENMAKRWSLPDAISKLIACHTTASIDPTQLPSTIMVLSSLLPAVNSDQWSQRESFGQAFERLANGKFSQESIFGDVDKNYSEVAPMMRLSGSIKSLLDIFDEVPVSA